MKTYPTALIAEGFKVARSSPVTSFSTAFVVFLMALTVFLSVGRSAVAEQSVVESLEQAGSRVIKVTATEEQFGLDREALDRLGRISGIERIVALGGVTDMENSWLPDGARIPMRPYFGDLAPEISVTSGVVPEPGNILIGQAAQSASGMSYSAGSLSAGQVSFAVTAGFTATGLLQDLNKYALRIADDSDSAATLIYLVAENATDIPALTKAVNSLTGSSDSANLTVTGPTVLADLQRVVSGQMGEFSRQIALATLVGGLLFVTAILFATTSSRRRDFGRRRALGASRSALVLVVLASTALPTLVGAVCGSAIGSVVVRVIADAYPRLSLIIAIVVISTLVGLVAAIPSAITSALRDPVRILRVA